MAKTARPPVVTIMGHVDHGKTTLLDYLRHSRVTAGEAGGITQHIGAYSVKFEDRFLTFIDTPGHAAFNKMRARGAAVTDLVVLVVAANDGVKPQTIESIRHIKEANVPYIVAINKTDLPDLRIDNVKAELAEQGVLVHGFGGDVEVVEISALKGTGVDNLLKTLVTMADLLELETDDELPLEAVVIESSMDERRGPVASVIIQSGTLKLRQDLVVEQISGRVRQLVNDLGANMEVVTAGFPAEILGLKDVPPVGSIIRDANAEYAPAESVELADAPHPSHASAVDELTDQLDQTTIDWSALDLDTLLEEKPKLKLIIKADVEGTLEAILQNLDPESTELLSSGVGQVTERDLQLAETSGATVIAFHTKIPNKIQKMAKQQKVKVKAYDVIYQLIEDLQAAQLKMLEPTIDEEVLGEAEILQIFQMRGDRIAGVRVKSGEIKRSDLYHLRRGDEIIANPVIKSMMHGKEEIASAKAKTEAGLTFKNKKLDFQVGDVLVAYKIVE